MPRPENASLPANLFYTNSKQYSQLTRLQNIQKEIASKCLDYMHLAQPSLILDLGCGTGISGRSVGECGHFWIGCDISRDMLMMASLEQSVDENNSDENKEKSSEEFSENSERSSEEISENSEINSDEYNEDQLLLNPLALLNLDIAHTLPFKTGSFDAFISVSCFQWLFHNRNIPDSRKIIRNVFAKLRSLLKYKGKGVIQFYPQHSEHTDIMIEESRKVGFYPELVFHGEGKKKKNYLLLDCTEMKKVKKKKVNVDRVRQKIMKMKERRIKKGLPVSRDSKYSGRKRCKKFR